MIKINKISQNKSIFRSLESSWIFLEIFNSILWNCFNHSPDFFWTFPGIFSKIPRNLLERSPEPFRTFRLIFSNSPRNFLDIPWNILKHSSEFSWTFLWNFLPGILKWKYFLEYSKSKEGVRVRKVISGNTTMIIFLPCPKKYFPTI